MDLKRILKELVDSCGNSLQDTLLSLLPENCEHKITPLNTLLVFLGDQNKEKLLIDAHMDTVGFVVTNITADGFIKVAPCGGVDCRVLPGSEVTVWGREPLYGVFTIMPPHLKQGNQGDVPGVEDQAIDVGLNYEKASKVVEVGDRVTMRCPFVELANRRVSSCGLDNLAGVAVLVALAHRLNNDSLPFSLVLQFSTFEETGHRYAGAVTGAFSVQPNEAIVVDASFAATPGLRYATPGKLGKEVMIGVSPMLSSSISRRLCSLAAELEIPYTKEVLGGASGTNADGIFTVGAGIPTGLLSFPLANMHTGVESVSLDDLHSLVNLLEAYCRKGGEENAK